jgi:hypothetical protein
MKLRIAVLTVLLMLCFAAASASADTIYTNGPINGTTDAWTFNFGFTPSNSFIVSQSMTQLTGLQFGAWLFPGDVLESAEVLIGHNELSGDISDQVLTFTQSNCSGNQYGFNVCVESGSFTQPVNLDAGTYWITLQNGVVNSGDPVYWDENSGPSMASETSEGTIPSEAFTLTGTSGTMTTSQTGSVPEPNSIQLFASGALGLVGVLRRKLF